MSDAFSAVLAPHGQVPLVAHDVSVVQINVGRRCNLACTHCHLDCGPDRTEEMSETVFTKAVQLAQALHADTLDITGGAPELHPQLDTFIPMACAAAPRCIVRSNLVVLQEDAYAHHMDLFARHGVEIAASLPGLQGDRVDRQRGQGTFEACLAVLRALNQRGYGMPGTGRVLSLAHNPVGAFVPASQAALEAEYRRVLASHGIAFTQLYVLTNAPLGRFGQRLRQTGLLTEYQDTLREAFNPATLPGLMCRHMVSVGWDGQLYDCDFNQALDIPLIAHNATLDALLENPDKRAQLRCRAIATGEHCFACAAGSGSSCQGALRE